MAQETMAMDSARAEAAQADFSIDDYGRDRPYQIVRPAYPAPKFLQRYANLQAALRECSTLCHLEGKPFRVVRWERTGSGNRGGVPCKTCGPMKPVARFPGHVPKGAGCLEGFPGAVPLAEFHPNGQRILFNKCGGGRFVGSPNYIVSHTPFPREYNPAPLPQRYLEAVNTAHLLAKRSGRRTFLCSDFGAECAGRNPARWVPVVYVDPGGLTRRYPNIPDGTTIVNPVSPAYFRELVAESRGATLLGQGA